MALPIAYIPVLTGDVAEEFEHQAQKTYDDYINRSEDEKAKAKARYERGMKMVKQILTKSKQNDGFDNINVHQSVH